MPGTHHVLVTGAAGGIGGAVADLMGQQDGTIVHRTDLGDDASITPCDLTDRDAVERLVDDLENDHGPLNGLAHCAARCGGAGAFHEVAPADWHGFIDANLSGTFHICQVFAKRLIKAGRMGRIVIIGSVNAIAAEPDASPYVASKGGVRMLAKAMAVDLGPFGIAVNLVHPGPIVVPRNRGLFGQPELAALFAQALPTGKAGRPIDVARAVRFLLDPDNAFVTGAELNVDGGLMAQTLPPAGR